MNIKVLIASAAFLGVLSIQAHADTVTTKTVVSQQKLSNVNEVNFMAFDLNGDGILDMPEVGDKLFQIFDQDGNHMIDNLEFGRKTVMTIIPMEKNTLHLVDYNNDGAAEVSSYSHEEFVQRSHLSMFDKNMDGLSAKEFIGVGYQKLDDDDDHLISLDEWSEAYIVSLHDKVDEPERYN